VRQTIVDELTQNARLYAAIAEEQGIGAADYVSESGMANEGVWGSDVEIFVAATLLQTPIAVYSAFGDRQYLWQVFEPIRADDESQGAAAAATSQPGSGFMIYLQNTNNHFEPVIDI
jgi:OTU-like cysteine protease